MRAMFMSLWALVGDFDYLSCALMVGFDFQFLFQSLCHEIIKTETLDDHLQESRPHYKSGKENDTQLTGDGSAAQTNLKPKEDPAETSSSIEETEKVLKKPDKILVCPRCNSLDTKFCYFNNYNVNQPRHFCKNAIGIGQLVGS